MEGLGLDMGGHHASYRANPGRPLLLLPALRSALCGDEFCGGRALKSVTMIMARRAVSSRTNDGYVEFNQRLPSACSRPTTPPNRPVLESSTPHWIRDQRSYRVGGDLRGWILPQGQHARSSSSSCFWWFSVGMSSCTLRRASILVDVAVREHKLWRAASCHEGRCAGRRRLFDDPRMPYLQILSARASTYRGCNRLPLPNAWRLQGC